jgi:uncharacterized protein (DUF433 family)
MLYSLLREPILHDGTHFGYKITEQPSLCGPHGRILRRASAHQGRRIPVSTIAEYVRSGESLSQIAALYPHIESAAIKDAIGYYFDHRREIDKEIEENSLEAIWLKRGLS